MNTQAITVVKPRLPMPHGAGIPPGTWRVLTDAIFPSAKSPDSIMLALDYCKARNLDIMKRPVNIVPVWSSQLKRYVENIWPSINEIEVTAARSGEWAGMDKPEFGNTIERTFTGRVRTDDGWQNESITLKFPEWIAVTVWRVIKGQRCAFTEPVYWEEVYGRQQGTELPNATWIKRTRAQAIKVAKATSLRAAFPEEADYSADEMEGGVIEAEPAALPAPAANWTPPHVQQQPAHMQQPPAAAGGTPRQPADAPKPPPPAPPPAEPEEPEPPPHPGPDGGPPEPVNAAVPDLVMPRMLGADQQPEDWLEWGKRFLARINKATLEEFEALKKANKGTMDDMKEEDEKLHIRLQAAINKRRDALTDYVNPLAGG